MKANIRNPVNFIISCICTFSVFFFLWLVVSGSALQDKENPVYFSDDGKLLCFFGETLYISRDNVTEVLDYPRFTADFCLGFLPKTLSDFTANFGESIANNFSESVKILWNAVNTVLRLGT